MSSVDLHSTTTAPHTDADREIDDGLPDTLLHPQSVIDLRTKIGLLSRSKNTTNKQREAFGHVLRALNFVNADATEARNVEHYNKLVGQIVRGMRDGNSMFATIEQTHGIPEHLTGVLGLPAPMNDEKSFVPQPIKSSLTGPAAPLHVRRVGR